MSGMNPVYAMLENTHGYAEKVAQVRENVDVLLKVAEEEGYDLSDLSEDEIVELANSLADQEGGEGEFEGFDPELPESADNMGPKHAEVKGLGQYMAHCYYNELEKIAKSKGERAIQQGMKEHRAPYEALSQKNVNQRVADAKKRGPTSMVRGAKETALVSGRRYKKPGMIANALGKLRRFGKAHKGALALGGVGLGSAALAAGATRALSNKDYNKKTSHIEDLDQAAINYANHLIEAAGQMDEALTFDKVAEANEDYLESVIAELGWSKLEDEGFIS